MKQDELIQECKLQLEYLNEKFGETGTTNALLSKLNLLSKQPSEVGDEEDDVNFHARANTLTPTKEST